MPGLRRQRSPLTPEYKASAMRDYWLTQYLLAAVGWAYLIVSATAIALALWLPKERGTKIFAAIIVLGVASILPIRGVQGYLKDKEAVEVYRARLAKAQALFTERCKTAGEKIYKTVQNVDGVLLMNLRPEKVNRDDQFERYDPYGWNGGGDEYIKHFVVGYWPLCIGNGLECPPEKRAFSYVEVIDEKGRSKRYTAVNKLTGEPIHLNGKFRGIVDLKVERPVLLKARYGVRWEDVSSVEDRQAWIAGGRISIIDLETETVVAERTGFLWDTGQGSTDGFRSPWVWASLHGRSCPSIDEHNVVFVRKVLKPIKGE